MTNLRLLGASGLTLLSEPVGKDTKFFEGWKPNKYQEPGGKNKAIGWGFNVDDSYTAGLLPKDVISGKRSLTEEEAEPAFQQKYKSAQSEARNYLGEDIFNDSPKEVQGLITDMTYNMGLPTMSEFKKLKQSIIDKDWNKAADELKDSKWYKQTGRRGIAHEKTLRDLASSKEAQTLFESTGKKSIANIGGGISSERSVTLNMEDGKFINIPTIIEGKQLSIQDAIDHSKKTGQNLGVFDTKEEAVQAAEDRVRELDKLSGGPGRVQKSPSSDIPGLEQRIEDKTPGPQSSLLDFFVPSAEAATGKTKETTKPGFFQTWGKALKQSLLHPFSPVSEEISKEMAIASEPESIEREENNFEQWAREGFPMAISDEESQTVIDLVPKGTTERRKKVKEWFGQMSEEHPFWFKPVYTSDYDDNATTRGMELIKTVGLLSMLGIMGAESISNLSKAIKMRVEHTQMSNMVSNIPKIENVLKSRGIALKGNMSPLEKIRTWAGMRDEGIKRLLKEASRVSAPFVKVPKQASPITTSFRSAQTPIPYVVGQMVQFGDKIGKIVNITGKAAQILTAAGEQIPVALDQLKATKEAVGEPGLPEGDIPPQKRIPRLIGDAPEPPPAVPPTDIVGFEGPGGEGMDASIQYERQKDVWLGEKDVRVLQSKIEQRSLQKETLEALGKKKYDQESKDYDKAIQIYIDTKRNPNHVAQYFGKLTPEQQKTVTLSQNLPANIQVIADKISQSYKELGVEALDAEVIRNVLDNYTARIWDIEGKKGTEKFRKFGTTTRHAKARTFDTIIEGWANDYKLKVEGATSNLQILKEELVKTIEDKKFINTLKKLRTIEGKPLLSTQQFEGYVPIEHPNFTTWKHAGKAPEVEATGKVYGRNFFRDEEGNLFERRGLYAPKEQAKNLNNILGVSKLKGIPVVDFATKWNAVVKAWILQSSFFHHLAFMRSYYFGTNHKQWDEMSVRQAYRQGVRAIEEENPLVMLGVRNGLTLGVKQDWDEELLRETSKLDEYLDKVKVVGKIKDKVLELRQSHVNFLFGEFGAGLKAKSFIVEYRNMVKKYPDRDPNDIARDVANLINDDFGGLHLQRLGRNPTVQHIFRLFALAPDWTESNVRTMVKSFKAGGEEETRLYRRFWAGIFTKAAILTVLGNALMSGLDEDSEEGRGFIGRMTRNYRRAWKEGRMRWADVDITALYKMLGGKTDNRKYFSVLGHF